MSSLSFLELDEGASCGRIASDDVSPLVQNPRPEGWSIPKHLTHAAGLQTDYSTSVTSHAGARLCASGQGRVGRHGRHSATQRFAS